jgi:phospholipid/cholesterol/gamma-HCH transport system substrate-binding protein
VSTPARLVGVGLFVLAGLLLFGIGLFMIGDRQMAFTRKFTVYTEFRRITGLQPGALVRVSGAKAGSVTAIHVPAGPGGRFHVDLDIAEDLHPLVRTDSVASIQTEGLVGGNFLSVSTGTEGAPPAPSHSAIASQEPFEIGDLLQQMSETVKAVNGTITLLQDDVQRAVGSMADVVGNVNELITPVGDNLKTMSSASARITRDAAEIADNLRAGKGTVGKLLSDDELYEHTVGLAKNAEQMAVNARQILEQARAAVAGLQSQNGPVQSLTGGLGQTLDEARTAMASLAEDMEALKHNFLFRGYFNSRGYFDLSHIAPADYRQGKAFANHRNAVRVWLSATSVYESGAENGSERMSDDGKKAVDSAIAPYLDRLAGSVVMVEGYSQREAREDQYLQSRDRAVVARQYLIARFHLDPDAIGMMPLGSESPGSPGATPWDGIALAVSLAKGKR